MSAARPRSARPFYSFEHPATEGPGNTLGERDFGVQVCYTQVVALLRRILYLGALAWLVVGVVLAVYPVILQRLLGQPGYTEHAWVRLFGIQAVGLALLMVLVGHRAEELWWWSWAFVLITGAVALLFTLNAAFGLPDGAGSALWWALAIGAWALGGSLLVGLSSAARRGPPDERPGPRP